MMVSLKNKIVIVTGASSGIGRAAALGFAKKGAKVVLAARRLEKLLKIENYVKRFNKNCISVATDVTKASDIKRMFDQTQKKFGVVDILVNNAGKGLPGKVHEISEKEWTDLMYTNLTSVFLCSQEAIKRMFKKRAKRGKKLKLRGHIITVSSIAGIYGAPGYAAYCASKHGVTGFQRSLKLELWKKGIKVSTIFPARVNTEFFSIYDEQPARGQMLSSKDVGNYIVTIASGSLLKRIAVRMVLVFKRIYNLVVR